MTDTTEALRAQRVDTDRRATRLLHELELGARVAAWLSGEPGTTAASAQTPRD